MRYRNFIPIQLSLLPFCAVIHMTAKYFTNSTVCCYYFICFYLIQETERRVSKYSPKIRLVFYFLEFDLLIFCWGFLLYFFLRDIGLTGFFFFFSLHCLWFWYPCEGSVIKMIGIIISCQFCSIFLEDIVSGWHSFFRNLWKIYWWNCLNLEEFKCEFNFFNRFKTFHVVS